MNKIFSILFAMFICMNIAAVPVTSAVKGSLTGKVTDHVDGSPLAGATVYLPELNVGVTTDANGVYTLTSLPAKEVKVEVSYLGHRSVTRSVDLAKTTTLDFVLNEQNAQLGEVVVTGLTGKALMKDSPTPVSVVNSAYLQSHTSTNVIDALSSQPGMAQITTGGGISKPVIRGLGLNRVVVVNDGVRQEGNQWGSEHGIEVDPQSVSSAEIIKGPASLMYGSDAMAGVVLFRGDPVAGQNTVKADAATEYQTNNGLFGYTAHVRGNQNGFVWNTRWSDKMAHAYKNPIDNYVIGSQFRERAAQGMMGLNRSWGYSHLTGSYYHLTPGMMEGERGYSHRYGKELPFQEVHHYKVISNNAFYMGGGTLMATLAYQQNRRQEFEESADTAGLDFMLHTVNYDIKYQLPSVGSWKFATGVGGMWQRSLNKGEEVLIPAYQLFDAGIFATASRHVGKFALSGGLRYDHRHLHSFALAGHFDAFKRNFSALTGSIGAVYALKDNMNLRLNLSRGFRAPNLGELGSNGVHEGTTAYELGNHELKPEFSWQIDAGWDFSSPVVNAQVSLFSNFIDHYIFIEKLAGVITGGHETYRYTQGNARLTGGEVSVDLHPVERLHFENSFSYVNSIQLHQPADRKYLPFTPAPRWNADVRYDFIRDGHTFNNLFAAVGVETNLRQNHFDGYNNTETATPSYTLVNLSAGTDIRVHNRRLMSLHIMCNNLFNRAYQSHLNRLKYVEATPPNGHPGLYNMGRNIGFKLNFYIL